VRARRKIFVSIHVKWLDSNQFPDAASMRMPFGVPRMNSRRLEPQHVGQRFGLKSTRVPQNFAPVASIPRTRRPNHSAASVRVARFCRGWRAAEMGFGNVPFLEAREVHEQVGTSSNTSDGGRVNPARQMARSRPQSRNQGEGPR